MNCPKCDHDMSKVLITRRDTVETIVRRRCCDGCGHRWYTVEVEIPDEGVQYRSRRMSDGPGWLLKRKAGYQRAVVTFE
jgi:transcriptional regulator NrdR family protein